MQPARDLPSSGGGSSMRRWGPIAAIVVVIFMCLGVVFLGGGDDTDSDYAPVRSRTSATIDLTGWECVQQGSYHWVCTR